MVSESEPMTTMMDGVAADSHGAAVIVRVYLSSTWSKAGSREEERKEGEREGGKKERKKPINRIPTNFPVNKQVKEIGRDFFKTRNIHM